MRLVNFNVEWMNNWFKVGSTAAFRENNPAQGIDDVDDLAKRVAKLIKTMDPDILTVEEGPSDIKEMELFVRTYLCSHDSPMFDIFGGIDGAQQKIYALVKKNGKLTNYKAADDEDTLKLKDKWESDIQGKGVVEMYHFTRLPLVIEGEYGNGKKCKIIAMHTKSNYVQDGEKLWKNPATRQQFIDIALVDRRRISSEAMRVRMYMDDLLSKDLKARIIITGDLNDGPGLDYFEMRYLTHNVIDIILGSTFEYESLFRHSFIDRVKAEDRYTVEFYDYVDKQNKKLLLDHIAVSPALAHSITSSGIFHAEYNAALQPEAKGDRQKRPSDHRPVYVDIE